MNVQTAVDNLAVNVRTLYENYKQNIHMDNDPYENLNTNLQFTSNQSIEPLNNTFASNQSIEPLNNTFASNQTIEPLNNTFGNMEPLQLDFKQTMNETSIIHEELAEKESRIRHLESIQIQNTNEISQLKAEKLEDRKKIKHLDNEVKKIKANPFLKWLERATEDSKKERII